MINVLVPSGWGALEIIAIMFVLERVNVSFSLNVGENNPRDVSDISFIDADLSLQSTADEGNTHSPVAIIFPSPQRRQGFLRSRLSFFFTHHF